MTSHYLNVLIESAWVASVVPMSAEPTFFAMLSFGGFNMPLAFALAVVGAMLGHLFNWYLGKSMLKLGARNSNPENEKWYDRAQRVFHKYAVFLLFFSWMPMLNLLVVLAGLLKVPLRTALPLIAAGQVVVYGIYLL